MKRGDFAQGLMAKGIHFDARKDQFVWALRINGDQNPDGSYPYCDIPLDCSIRLCSAKEVMLYSKAELSGGWKITFPGSTELKLDSWDRPVGEIREDMQVVRGVALDESGDRPIVTSAEPFDIIQIERLKNQGSTQEYWMFVVPLPGGPTRG